MNWIIVVDKPSGWTSHDVVAKLRGILKEKRIGHGGTLDPMATGLLPVFIGSATRAAQFFENAEKEYIAGLRLGLVADTQDITGKIISKSNASVSAAELDAVLPRFLGAGQQIPPMYSALKKDGKKLYELARRGIDVPRPARDIYISAIELTGGSGDEYTLRVTCSKGTYIRTLCHDIGQALGCGGVMSSLRRTRAGEFTIDMAHPLEEIQRSMQAGDIDELLLKTDIVFRKYPAAALNENDTKKCRNGAPCNNDDLTDGIYRFYGPDDEFIMLGEVISGKIKIIKGFFTDTGASQEKRKVEPDG